MKKEYNSRYWSKYKEEINKKRKEKYRELHPKKESITPLQKKINQMRLLQWIIIN